MREYTVGHQTRVVGVSELPQPPVLSQPSRRSPERSPEPQASGHARVSVGEHELPARSSGLDAAHEAAQTTPQAYHRRPSDNPPDGAAINQSTGSMARSAELAAVEEELRKAQMVLDAQRRAAAAVGKRST